jgi:WD40 repeat protein/serine/threonine protein kinase
MSRRPDPRKVRGVDHLALRRRVPDAGKVRELFDAVVNLPPDERPGYLDQHGPDPLLRRRVEVLLAADARQRAADASGQREPAAVAPGYEILARLGDGGMGVVYKARQTKLNRIVALKMILSGSHAAPEEVARFKTEAEAIARLQHPNIVQVFEVGESEGRPFIALEFVDGPSLAARLAGTPQPPLEAARLVEVLARAVQHAHERGVVHRDLKPANVLLACSGGSPNAGTAAPGRFCEPPLNEAVPKITDFGLAKRLDEQGPTRTGALLGTAPYMAPEQAAGRTQEIGPATDVYALGAILYECLTGRPPFKAATTLETLEQVLYDEPVSPRRLQPKVPRPLETICLKCLQKDLRHRYASAAELADDLPRFLNGEPIRARPVGRLTRLWLWCRRNPALAGASALSAAALLIIVVLGVSYGFAQHQFGVEQHRLAENLQTALAQTQREAALSTWDHGRRLCEEGEVGHGLLLVVRALQRAPADDNLRDALRRDLAGWHRLCHTLCQVWRHPGAVLAVAVSPDGKTAVTGCADGKVRLWDLASGRLRRKRLGHQGGVCAVAFSHPCGDSFLTGGADGTVLLWDAATGQPLGQPLRGHKGKVCAVALHCDGKLALSGGEDHTARLWALPTRTTLALIEYPGRVRAVAFSPDGPTFLTGGEKEGGKGEVRLHRTGPAHLDRPVRLGTKKDEEFSGGIRSAAFSPDGRTLLVGDNDWKVSFWDVGKRKRFAVVNHNGSVLGVAFAQDGKTALTGAHEANTANLWDVDALLRRWQKQEGRGVVEGIRPLDTPLLHRAAVTAVAFGADEKQLLTACTDGYVRVWKRAPGQGIVRLRHPTKADPEDPRDEQAVLSVAFHPKGRLVATAGWDDKLRLWNVPTGDPAGDLPHPRRVRAAAFTPDGKTVVTGCADGQVRFWDLATRRKTGRKLPHPNRELSWLRLSPDGSLILTARYDGIAQVWNVKSRNKIPQRLWHPGGISVTAISPDNKRFLTDNADGTVRVWGAKGKLICELPHDGEIWDVKFSPGDGRPVTASHRAVRFWDVSTGTPRTTLPHRGPVSAFAFAPGQRMLTGGMEEGGQLWDIRLRRRIGPNYRLEHEVVDVAVSPDGTIAVLADWDGYGVLWSLPQPVRGDLQRITLWAQTAVGLELDEGGGPRVLSGSSWQELQEQLRQRGGPP